MHLYIVLFSDTLYIIWMFFCKSLYGGNKDKEVWISRWVRLQTPWRHGHKNFIGGLVPAACFGLGPRWLNLGFSLALTLCELRSLFVSSQYLYTFDCFFVVIHWIRLHTSLTIFLIWEQQNLGRKFGVSKPPTPQSDLGWQFQGDGSAVVDSFFAPIVLWGFCFIVHYFESFLFLQSSHLGRKSWLLYFNCLLMSFVCQCSMSLPHGAVSWSVICDCCTSC